MTTPTQTLPALDAVVYPPDGTVSPFTVINLGTGRVQMGDSIHDGRLPALWFGKNGQGIGHEEVLDRQAHEGETLAVVTFANVEGLDVLLDVIQRIRRVSFPGAAPQQTAPQAAHVGDEVPMLRWPQVVAYPGGTTDLGAWVDVSTADGPECVHRYVRAAPQAGTVGAPTAEEVTAALIAVGRDMVNITTTVHGIDEWPAIPTLWLQCMKERDALRATPPAAPVPTVQPLADSPWRKLYRRAINEANGLTNYVEDRPELRGAERRLAAIEAEARTLAATPAPTPEE